MDPWKTLRILAFAINRMNETDYIDIPDPMLIQGDNIMNLLSAIYLEMLSSKNVVGLDPQSLIKLVILTSINSRVAEINHFLIQRFPGEVKAYFNAD